MTRETKAGLLMILMLAGVFGFMVYKRLHQPAAAMAQQNAPDDPPEPEADGAPAEAAPERSDPFLADTEPAQPQKVVPTTTVPTRLTQAPIAKAVTATPTAESDPFGDVVATPTRTKPPLPTPVEDPFDEPVAKAEEASSEPTDATTIRTVSAPEVATTATREESDPFDTDVAKPAVAPANTARPAAFSDPDPFGSEQAEPVKANLSPPANARPTPVEDRDLPDTRADDPFTNTPSNASDGFEAPVVVKSSPASGFSNKAQAQSPAADDPFAADNQLEVQRPANPAKVSQIQQTPEFEIDVPRSSTPAAALEPAIEDAFESPPPKSNVPSLTIPSRDHMPKDVSPQADDRFGGFRPATPTTRAAAPVSSPSQLPSMSAENPPRRPIRPAPVSQIDEDFGASAPARPLIAGDTYQVEPSDNFWTISRKKYGTGRYFMALAQHNSQVISDPKRMKPGVTIATPSAQSLEQTYPQLIPKTAAVDPIQTASAATPAFTAQAPAAVPAVQAAEVDAGFFVANDGTPMYRVGREDTLSGIAQRHLGRSSRWVQVFELNRDVLTDGNTLKIGALLRLPADASRVDMVGGVRSFR